MAKPMNLEEINEKVTAKVFAEHDSGNSRKIFMAVGKTIMYGKYCVAIARSRTMALRLAKAANKHKPNERGV
jgi:hypothetical protein